MGNKSGTTNIEGIKNDVSTSSVESVSLPIVNLQKDQQRKRKSADSAEGAQSGETMRKVTKNSPDQHLRDPDTTRLRETVLIFAKTLTLLTQMCDKAVSGQSEISSTQQGIRTSRTLSSTLAAAVRVASALSATSAVRQRETDDQKILEKSIQPPEKNTIDKDGEKEGAETITSTPKKEKTVEIVKISSAINTENSHKNHDSKVTEKEVCDKEGSTSRDSPERRKTRRSSQNR